QSDPSRASRSITSSVPRSRRPRAPRYASACRRRATTAGHADDRGRHRVFQQAGRSQDRPGSGRANSRLEPHVVHRKAPDADGGQGCAGAQMTDAAPTSESNGQHPRKATAFYVALVAALDRRRRAVGFTFEDCDDRSGNPDRYTAKGFHPNTLSGRQMSWQVLQTPLDALFPCGLQIPLKPKPVPDQRALNRLRKQEPVPRGGASQRRYRDFIEVCRLGGLASHKARMEKHSPEQRARFPRQAARARSPKLTPAERRAIARAGARARRRQAAPPPAAAG